MEDMKKNILIAVRCSRPMAGAFSLSPPVTQCPRLGAWPSHVNGRCGKCWLFLATFLKCLKVTWERDGCSPNVRYSVLLF